MKLSRQRLLDIDSLSADETVLKTMRNFNSDINLEHGKEDIVFISSVYLKENIGTME